MRIESYSRQKCREVVDLFQASVHAIDSSLYTPDQKNAWAPTPPDYDQWEKRLEKTQPFLALIDDRVAGFMELEADGHIDCVYTHPEFQRKGVASALYKHLLKEASIRGIRRLYVEASYVAKPFFDQRGFLTVQKNEVQRHGVSLVNITMEKEL